MLTQLAEKNIKDIIDIAIAHPAGNDALVIYDTEAPLAQILVDAYKNVLPNATFLRFHDKTQQEVMDAIYAMKPRDLVVLVQSGNFRLDEFRIRIELFKRSLTTIEHMNLERMSEDQFETYINALAYDPEYYRVLGPKLKDLLDTVKKTVVTCGDVELIYDTPMEEAKLNIGDYRAMENIGGTYPIGEVFTEARDFSKVNGYAKVFAFAGKDHKVKMYEPFLVKIEGGILSAGSQAPAEFHEILDMIRLDEEVHMREFGLSLNPAISRKNFLNDITAFERMKGLHVSLGAKHGVYNKPGFHRKKSRYHVDVFFDISKIQLDDVVIFEDGEYRV